MVGTARLVVVEACLEVEDGTAMLNRNHSSGGEAPTIPDSVDLIQNRQLRVARAQEVRVERVDVTIRLIDGASGSDQRLASDLSAEDPHTVFICRGTPENIHLDRFQIEQRHEVIECLLVILSGRDVGIHSHEDLMLPCIGLPMHVPHPIGAGTVSTAP